MAEATPDVLALHTAADPDKTAVIDGDRVMNRRDFNALVNQYAAVMLDANVVAGEKVLWVGQNSLEVVAINHAARKVGAVCVPMNYRLSPEESQYVIDNCDAVVVISQADKEETSTETVAQGFAPLTRAVVTVPYDPALRQQWLRVDALSPASRAAWLAAAAAVAEGL